MSGADKKNEGNKWKPGQSGNPAGRRKGQYSLKRILENKLAEVDERDYLKRTKAERIADILIWYAIQKKSLKAASEIMDRVLGRPAQAVTLDGNLNLTREQRIAKIEELLTSLPKPAEQPDGTSDTRVN